MRRIKDRKRITIFAAVLLAVLVCLFGCPGMDDVSAADTLSVKAGFYGGPYHTIETYSYDDMKSMSSGNVITYSGMDTGNFVRVCYAQGVKLSTIFDKCGIDMDSVKFIHVSTDDSYGESTTTFSSDILNERYFFPDLAKNMPESGQLTEFKSSYSGNAKTVPAILAISCTDFSRSEALRVRKEGTYKSLSASDLSEKYRYRLIYGQSSLQGSLSNGYNVQTSGKYVQTVEIQLSGSPKISVTKKMISGESGKVGSKYLLTASAELPSDYSYLSDQAKSSLKKQIVSGIKVKGYDSSVVRVTGLTKSGTLGSDGSCTVETLKKGKTTLTFSYSRKDYGGGSTTASASSGISTSKGGGGSSSSGKSEYKEAGGDLSAKAAAAEKASKGSKSAGSGKDWISFDAQNNSVDINAKGSGMAAKVTWASAIALLAAGIVGETVLFRRQRGAAGRSKKKRQRREVK